MTVHDDAGRRLEVTAVGPECGPHGDPAGCGFVPIRVPGHPEMDQAVRGLDGDWYVFGIFSDARCSAVCANAV